MNGLNQRKLDNTRPSDSSNKAKDKKALPVIIPTIRCQSRTVVTGVDQGVACTQAARRQVHYQPAQRSAKS
jgi:hypothetical protein